MIIKCAFSLILAWLIFSKTLDLWPDVLVVIAGLLLLIEKHEVKESLISRGGL